MYKCFLCNKDFDNVTKIVSHLTHQKSTCKTNIKEYYDKFLRKPNEGMCQFCGRETTFGSLVKGYINNTCKHCRNNKPETKKLRKERFSKKATIREEKE